MPKRGYCGILLTSPFGVVSLFQCKVPKRNTSLYFATRLLNYKINGSPEVSILRRATVFNPILIGQHYQARRARTQSQPV